MKLIRFIDSFSQVLFMKFDGLRFFSKTFSGSQLNQQLDNWLDKAELTFGPARAIIAPYVN